MTRLGRLDPRASVDPASLVAGRVIPASVVVLVAVVLLAGCNSVASLDIPAPPPGARALPPTTVVALANQPEGPVAGGAPTTSVAVGPGTASINGTVFGPNGPVQGATVEVDRLVGDQTAVTEAITAADGSFNVPDVLGGRYRLRAWKAPTLTMTEPQVFFLAATDTHAVNLLLSPHQGLKVSAALNPSAPFTGEAANLAVEVTQPTVDPTGVVVEVPQVAISVALQTTNFAATDASSGEGTTNAQGKVVFVLSCLQDGPAPIAVIAGGSTTVSIETPVCLDPLSTTTTTPSTTTASTATASTTTASAPGVLVPVSLPLTPTSGANGTPPAITPSG